MTTTKSMMSAMIREQFASEAAAAIAAKEKAYLEEKMQADYVLEAERAAAAAAVGGTGGAARARKPKSRKTYGKKNYTNAKGYPRKPRTYG